jgi:transcription elongation GreA/GreB family factor
MDDRWTSMTLERTRKQALLQALRSRLHGDLEALERRQRDIQEGAVHEESRAEHAKDTRATEQSYLARGLAERVAALRRTSDAIATLEPPDFGPGDAVAVGALVVLSAGDAGGTQSCETWLIVPGAGGLELRDGDERVRTLTPVSPLGRALLGLRVGEGGSVRTPRGERDFEVRGIA